MPLFHASKYREEGHDLRLSLPLCCRRRNLFVYVRRSQGHLGGIAHWPHPVVVVGISTKLFVREETVSWYAHVIPYRASRPFWCCFMRTLCKFCVFVSGRHCRYFEVSFFSCSFLCFIELKASYASDFKVKSFVSPNGNFIGKMGFLER